LDLGLCGREVLGAKFYDEVTLEVGHPKSRAHGVSRSSDLPSDWNIHDISIFRLVGALGKRIEEQETARVPNSQFHRALVFPVAC
jgi:hypothetical protein